MDSSKEIINIAKSMGITSPILNSPSLALGTSEVTLLELTSAYNVLANNGNGVFSYGIRSIEDTDGEILFSRKLQGTGKELYQIIFESDQPWVLSSNGTILDQSKKGIILGLSILVYNFAKFFNKIDPFE